MPVSPNPLSRGDLNQINSALTSLQGAAKLIERAKACGCSIDALDEDCKLCIDTLSAIKREFFITRPDDVAS